MHLCVIQWHELRRVVVHRWSQTRHLRLDRVSDALLNDQQESDVLIFILATTASASTTGRTATTTVNACLSSNPCQNNVRIKFHLLFFEETYRTSPSQHLNVDEWRSTFVGCREPVNHRAAVIFVCVPALTMAVAVS
jgi:hypothetical protein